MSFLQKVQAKAANENNSKSFSFTINKQENVSRPLNAKFKVILSVDLEAVDKAAKYTATSDIDHDDKPIKYEDAYKSHMKEAESELKSVKASELIELQSKYDVQLRFKQKFYYLKVSFSQKPEDLEFKYSGGEVFEVTDPTYTLE